MGHLTSYLASNPWIWLVAAVGFAVWACSIWIIVKSDKFLRKWLWILLTFVSFTFKYSIGPGVSLGIGIPLGALYVLWFARYGRAPTSEERAKQAARAEPPVSVSIRQMKLLQLAYGGFAAATAAIFGWAVLGPARMVFQPSSIEPAFAEMATIVGSLSLAAFVATTLFLIYRPYWWGKVLCGFAALSWIGHAAISGLVFPAVLGRDFPAILHALIVGGCGVVALLTCLIHHRIDPRFAGSYLRTL